MTENLWAKAAQATTVEDANAYFQGLLWDMMRDEPYTDTDALKERVVANILWMSGYYNTSEMAGRLYSHFSSYRR
jgi:hypothetical protein